MPESPQDNQPHRITATNLAVAAATAIFAVYVAGYTRTDSLPPPPHTPPATIAARWKDGDWVGRGHCHHGDIITTVTIRNGRIQTAIISQCLTRYACSVIDELPPQVLQRQSPEVDFVSGATESTEAFYTALTEALSRARL